MTTLLDWIDTNPLFAFLIGAFLIATLAVWIGLKIDDRKRSTRHRQCLELERMLRL